METFNTVHVFWFGDVQIIGKDHNGTVKSSTLTKLDALVNHIKTFKPEDVTLTDYHAINIFDGNSVRYLGKQAEDKTLKTSFSVEFSKVDTTILGELISEIVAALAV